jgi:hypothetical protein
LDSKSTPKAQFISFDRFLLFLRFLKDMVPSC